MASKEVGHTFLARLGKKRLRPGGVTATHWLFQQVDMTPETKVLEVACNMGTTAIELVKMYGCQVTGVDRDASVIEKARKNVKHAGLTQQVVLLEANAMHLPFEDNSFDVVINEAMLTMLQGKAKEKAIAEYLRVLKPGGKLLTQDVAYEEMGNSKKLDELSQTINIHVDPLSIIDWQQLFKQVGFETVKASFGPMSLMSPRGMIKDEGFLGAAKIFKNGLKKVNREQFLEMFSFFHEMKNDLCYIAVCSTKGEVE